jgi:hypothetical protein
MRNGRCRMHGGASLSWFAHPNYKHGKYSKYSGVAEAERQEREYLKSEKRSEKKRQLLFEMVAEKESRLGRELTVKEYTVLVNIFFPVK